ncbi:MAG: twin-arginine translocase TatA/TatE family subunit [Halobacteria archaeon]|nr:twin-arginine translocase TatA/TatE family subunit [Halobacteria archaeon]
MIETPIFMGGVGPLEIGIVGLLVILLFGADKLPKLARGAGEAMGEFKKAKNEADEELSEITEEVEEAAKPGSTTD